jgi:hypothetical protein
MTDTEEKVETTETKPAGETPAVEQPEQKPTETDADVRAELARTQKALKDANREAAERRKKLEAFEAEETKRKEAELTEVQKLQKRLEESEAKAKAAAEEARKTRIENAIIAKARDRFVDLEDVVLKLRDGIQLDDDGKPVDLDKALDELAAAKPHWVKQAAAPEKPKTPAINPTNPGAGGAPAKTDAELRAEIWGMPSRNTIFNPARTKQHGGGVVEVSKRK